MPARGIQFDAATYSLNNIDILPYFGCGNISETGYGFVPDGSGAIIRFEDVADANVTVAAQLYGNDSAFHDETFGTAYGGNMEIWRLPVFGIVRNSEFSYVKKVSEQVQKKDSDGNPMVDENGSPVMETVEKTVTEKDTVTHGYVGIITEGESLSRLQYNGGGSVNPYQTMFMKVFPRQTDSYPLSGLTVSGGTATYTVQCKRRYVGNYTIKFKMLYDKDATYVGMAKAYRDYLIGNGELSKLENTGDIPLYIETMGDIDAIEKKVGMPVNVKKPLTTFDQAQTILQELMDAGIKNLNLKYIGWYNGGLYNTPPCKLSVDSVLGGENGLKALNEFAEANNIGLFPDFDYLYVHWRETFDGFNMRQDAAQTVEGRFARQKYYFPAAQAYFNAGPPLISSNVILSFYSKIKDKFNSYGIKGISFETMGQALNSDNNDEAPLNREDSKELIIDFLKNAVADGKEVVVSGGNAYTIPYATHILGVPLDSSNRNYESENVPFIGIVLHGYKEFSGTAINLAGDYKYNFLKLIENGADPYFVMSYDNTATLRNSDYSRYYSVQYSIWKDDVISTYKELNDVLSKVRTATIEAHGLIDYRVVQVTYSNGVKFILNYNNYEVEINGEKIPALGYLVK
ncbi:hypothetical protein SDC9_98856 [bioreactor metagenome]|uniref:Uncharacterized protein n=1 Tax=bioreactor metagenome TaxID=1076179 RepID=A0A645AFY5_9ZZZZ